jgi:hypothetical protein
MSSPSRPVHEAISQSTGFAVASQELSGIEDALCIEGRLKRAHQIELDLRLDGCELPPLRLSDAVFGGNRIAERERDLVDGVRQFLPSRQEFGLGHVGWAIV